MPSATLIYFLHIESPSLNLDVDPGMHTWADGRDSSYLLVWGLASRNSTVGALLRHNALVGKKCSNCDGRDDGDHAVGVPPNSEAAALAAF